MAPGDGFYNRMIMDSCIKEHLVEKVNTLRDVCDGRAKVLQATQKELHHAVELLRRWSEGDPKAKAATSAFLRKLERRK